MAPPLDPDDQRPDAFAEPLSGRAIRGVPLNPRSAPQSEACPSIRGVPLNPARRGACGPNHWITQISLISPPSNRFRSSAGRWPHSAGSRLAAVKAQPPKIFAIS